MPSFLENTTNVALPQYYEMECMSMEKSKIYPRSHLFTVRVWEEETGADQTEWRGKVQLLSSGEVRYFREWAALMPLLRTMLLELASEEESNQ